MKLKAAIDYRNSLCEHLDISVKVLHGKSRLRPIPLKRQIVTYMIYKRFGKRMAKRDIGIKLMNYSIASAHSMVIYNVREIKDLLSVNDEMVTFWHDQALQHDEIFDAVEHDDQVEQKVITTTERPMVYYSTPTSRQRSLKFKRAFFRGMFLISVIDIVLVAMILLRLD